MNKDLYKCSNCYLVMQKEDMCNLCIKCGSSNLDKLSSEVASKIYMSDKTNVLLARLISLTDDILDTCLEGIDINLDDNCVKTFNHIKDISYNIRQYSKSEIETHVHKSKF